MLQRSRQRNSAKKKIIAYILFLIFLILLLFTPFIFVFTKDISIISPLGKNNVNISRVEKILKEKNIPFSSVTVLGDSSYLVKLINNSQVRLSFKKNIDYQVASLQRILTTLTIEGKPFKSIDFRFTEPIVSF